MHSHISRQSKTYPFLVNSINKIRKLKIVTFSGFWVLEEGGLCRFYDNIIEYDNKILEGHQHRSEESTPFIQAPSQSFLYSRFSNFNFKTTSNTYWFLNLFNHPFFDIVKFNRFQRLPTPISIIFLRRTSFCCSFSVVTYSRTHRDVITRGSISLLATRISFEHQKKRSYFPRILHLHTGFSLNGARKSLS